MREICQCGFDEREEETELRQTGLRRRGESPATCHRKATVTAPLLDSTRHSTQNPSPLCEQSCKFANACLDGVTTVTAPMPGI